MIVKFFRNLTKKNWGFPWHLWLATILAILFFGLYTKWLGQIFAWTAVLSFLTVMAIGYINEVVDRDKDPTEFWEDMGANMVGAIAGLALVRFLIWALL